MLSEKNANKHIVQDDKIKIAAAQKNFEINNKNFARPVILSILHMTITTWSIRQCIELY